MAVFLHAVEADGETNDINHADWVDVDLFSWSPPSLSQPCRLTIVRRLNKRKPCLQGLMFANVYYKKRIQRITLEIPVAPNSDEYRRHTLIGVQVLSYQIIPSAERNARPREKLVLAIEQHGHEKISY